MPELSVGQYMADAFMDLGLTKASATGEFPLDWLDVWAYSQAAQTVSEPWEFRLLINMSRGYLRAKQDGEGLLAIPPMDQGE